MSHVLGMTGHGASQPRAGRRTRRTGCLWIAALVLFASAGMAAESPYKATTSRSARDEAIGSIPFDKLEAGGQAKISSVLSNVSMYRRMPTQVTRCDPDLYLFMINHPDVTVNLWQVLDVTNIQLEQTGPNSYRANDGQGTKGDVEFLYRSHDFHILYAVGTYEGPLFHKPVRGSCLLLLKTGYSREPDGHYYITSQLDTFFNVEHVGLDLITKTFHPLVGKAADYNFVESANFLGTLQRTGELRPTAMQQLAGKLTNIQPAHREQFAMLMAAIPQKAAGRQSGPSSGAPDVTQPGAAHPTGFRR